MGTIEILKQLNDPQIAKATLAGMCKIFGNGNSDVRQASVMVTIEILKQLNEPQIAKATLAEMSKLFYNEDSDLS
jgi:uncharacterized protein YjgD (DUF1641 family)